MNEEKCFCHFNGYKVKDADARIDIETLKTKTNTLENELATNKTTVSAMNSDVVKNKTDVEVIKQDIETLKTNTNLHTDSINTLNESNTNLDRKMGELALLQTTDKSSIVGAVNSMKETLDASDLTALSGELNTLKGQVSTLESDNTTNKAEIENFKGYVLFESEIAGAGENFEGEYLGVNTDLTLNESAKNYDYVEIYFRTGDTANYKGSAKVLKPGYSFFILDYLLPASNGLGAYMNMSQIKIDGTALTRVRNTQITLENNKAVVCTNMNNLYITKIIGYKKEV